MRFVLGILLGMVLPATARAANGVDAFYPEGPLNFGGTIYYGEMQRDRVIRWEAGDTRIFFFRRGCGPTAIAPFDDGFVILCHLSNRLITVTQRGQVKEVLWRDQDLATFENPNDAGADDQGGVYFSASGVFSRSAPREGALLYLDPDGEIFRLADGYHYTNGVVFDAANQRVLVSEHLGNRILSFPVIAPGRVGRPSVFADLSALGLGDWRSVPPQGPDGLEIDRDGNIYAAYYGGGKLLVFGSNGGLKRQVSWSQPLITSVTLSSDERMMVLTGSTIGRGNLWSGRVEWVPNPLHQGPSRTGVMMMRSLTSQE